MSSPKTRRYWLYQLDNRTRGQLYIFAVAKRLSGSPLPRKVKALSHWRAADRLELRDLGEAPARYVARLLRRYADHLREARLDVLVGPAPRLSPSRGRPS